MLRQNLSTKGSLLLTSDSPDRLVGLSAECAFVAMHKVQQLLLPDAFERRPKDTSEHSRWRPHECWQGIAKRFADLHNACREPKKEQVLPELSSAYSGDDGFAALPCSYQDSIGCIEAVIDAAGAGLELIALDNTGLCHQHFATLVDRLRQAGASNPAMAISLANNELTDDSCNVLKEAFQDMTFCPSVLTINLRDNLNITEHGHKVLEQICLIRPDLQITCQTGEIGAPDDVGLEAFRKGAIISEEELPHARPTEQWAALEDSLAEVKASKLSEPSDYKDHSIFRLSQILREICDAVEHETCKEEAIDPAEAQAQSGVIVTKKVKLPPGEYCLYAVKKLNVLREVITIAPAPVQTAALPRPSVGVGSHRFHACALLCALVRCACDKAHNGSCLQADIVQSGLIPPVAHLAFSSPNCSCLHTVFLDAFSIHTLPHMPSAFWGPLLTANLGNESHGVAVALENLPDCLFRLGSRALTQPIGERSGLIGMVIQLGRDLHHACEDNEELRGALGNFSSWKKSWGSHEGRILVDEGGGGPLAQLVRKQQGSLAGGKPSALNVQGEDDGRSTNIPLQALLGIREFAQMHQSLNLGVPLQ